MGVMTPAITQSIIFVGGLMFYLVGHKQLRSAMVMLLSDREDRLTTLRILGDIDRNMTIYFGTFTVVNLALGVITMALAYVAGLPNPLLWGVLAFTTNFIPYVGPVIVTATLFVVGLLTFQTVGQALFAPVAFVIITTIEGHLLTPAILGHRLTLNAFAVFIAIAFWTWLWGPIGAFLAVPLLMALIVVLRHMRPNEKIELPA
jgi:predicted PurR-regulated permease PerM